MKRAANYIRLILVLIVTVLIATAASCRGTANDDGAEKGPRAVMTAWKLEAESEEVILTLSGTLTSEEISGGTLTVKLSDNKGDIAAAEMELPAEPEEIRLSCPTLRIWDELYITAVYELEGKEYGRIDLEMFDKKPQLSRDSIKCVVNAMTDYEKARLVVGTTDQSMPGVSGVIASFEMYGIPSIAVNDGPAGVRYYYSVWYPSMMNLASSWDTDQIYKVGKAIGQESLAHNIDIVLGPGMNIQKNVLGGRNFEYFSEDPLVTALAASAYVRGLQSTGAGACPKHFCVNNQETYRGSVSSVVTERALRDIYLKAFEYVIKNASPMSLMSSYNCLNGVHTSVNKELLTGIVRGEFGFQNAVMSDWGAAGSVREKVNAQNDLSMPGSGDELTQFREALEKGKVDIEALDQCVEHILNTIVLSPTFNGVKMNYEVDFETGSKLSRETAVDTMVLLKNDGSALPLKSGTEVAVFGNGSFNTLFGGAGSGSVNAKDPVNIMDGIDASSALSVYDKKYNIFNWCEAHSEKDPSKDVKVSKAYAEECAANADAAVIVISRNSEEGADNIAGEGGFLLNATEAEMVENVSAAFHNAGKKVIAVLNTGNPIEVLTWRDKVDAILWCGYPGERAGEAVADVLSGKVNPSGKTVISWPATYESTPASDYFPGKSQKAIYFEDIYVGYRYYTTFGVDTAYPFGYGLSYTNFTYSDFSVTDNGDGTYKLKLTVKNTGNKAGREVVEFYVSRPEGMLDMPAYELCGFAKTKSLKAGASQTVEITVTEDWLCAYDEKNSRYIVPDGEYVFYAGSSSADLEFSANVTRSELVVTAETEKLCAPAKEFEHLSKAAVSAEQG